MNFLLFSQFCHKINCCWFKLELFFLNNFYLSLPALHCANLLRFLAKLTKVEAMKIYFNKIHIEITQIVWNDSRTHILKYSTLNHSSILYYQKKNSTHFEIYKKKPNRWNAPNSNHPYIHYSIELLSSECLFWIQIQNTSYKK